MAELSNDNLTLWLKAKDGLPCEDARALIEAHNEIDREYSDHLAKGGCYSQDEYGEACTESYEEGRADGRHEALREARDWILDRMEGVPKAHEKTLHRVAALLQGMLDGYTPASIKA